MKLQSVLAVAMAAELPPAGIPDEIWKMLDDTDQGLPSQYELWSAMTALTQEVKLQGRAFKQLDEGIVPLKESIASQLRAHDEALAQARRNGEQAAALSAQRLQEARKEAEEKVRSEFLGALLEVHDRLSRALESSRSSRKALGATRGWWLGGRRQLAQALEAMESLEQGQSLGLESLEELLKRHQVERIPALEHPFDPQTMNAVEIEETLSSPEGTVMEVLLPGYLWRGALFRPAQVKVARSPKQKEKK